MFGKHDDVLDKEERSMFDGTNDYSSESDIMRNRLRKHSYGWQQVLV